MASRIIEFWNRHEKAVGFGGLALGFTFDLFLAKRPDSIADNILLLFYIVIAGSIIVLLNLRSARKREEEHPVEPLLLLLFLQFCFGGLANNLLILYGKSGTLGGSLLFIGLLAALALGNEFLKTRYGQLRLNIAVYYFLVLTYAVIAIPTFILHEIGLRAFLISGAVSLVFIAVFLAIIHAVVLRGRGRGRQLRDVSVLVLVIFGVFAGLYFSNIIPPVPLSLKQIGVYHSLVRDGAGDYAAAYEPAPWYVFWRDTSATLTLPPGEPAYCFSAVYAPSALSTPIYHRWEYFDATAKEWLGIALVQFPITGGRAAGYREFSEKRVLAPGEWRCDVETAGGQLIGRISFTIVESSTTPPLSTTTL